MKSIALIIPYIGKWPIWFESHLVSIAKNPTVNWIFITDCEIPSNYPQNVRFIPSTLKELNEKVNNVLQIVVPLSPRKLCDLRPAYGAIFKEYIKEYDFWGFCDLDIIWGDIRKFITADILDVHDIISSRKNAISGHFTILRNTEKINSLYKQIPDYFNMLLKRKLKRIDEEAFTDFVFNLERDGELKVYWKEYLMNHKNGFAHQEYELDKWLWKDGKMLELKNGNPVKEVMYLHFINWKGKMRYSEVVFKDPPRQFYISYNGMHFDSHSKFVVSYNSLKNIFLGYAILQKRIKYKRKLRILRKRIINKLK